MRDSAVHAPSAVKMICKPSTCTVSIDVPVPEHVFSFGRGDTRYDGAGFYP